MAFNTLRELSDAVGTYVHQYVPVNIYGLSGFGNFLSPTENFTFRVSVTNATQQTGLKLSNVRLTVFSRDENVAKIRVPEIPGAQITRHAIPIVANALVDLLTINFPSNHEWDVISSGETPAILTFSGRALAVGECELVAHITADLEVGGLIAQNRVSRFKNIVLTVQT